MISILRDQAHFLVRSWGDVARWSVLIQLFVIVMVMSALASGGVETNGIVTPETVAAVMGGALALIIIGFIFGNIVEAFIGDTIRPYFTALKPDDDLRARIALEQYALMIWETHPRKAKEIARYLGRLRDADERAAWREQRRRIRRAGHKGVVLAVAPEHVQEAVNHPNEWREPEQ